MTKKVLLVGPTPKSLLTGVALCFQSLIDGFEENGIPFFVVNTSIGASSRKKGVFSFKRAFFSILIILLSWIKMLAASTVYITISSSKLGFLRDFFIIWATFFLRKRLILHLHGGGYTDFYKNQPEVHRQIIKRTLAQANYIIVLGDILRKQFSFVPDAEKKIKVIPNGLTSNLNPNFSKHKTLPGQGESLRILYLSNLIKSKGYLDLLEACNLLNKNGFLEFTCDFCGAFVQTIHDKHGHSNEQLKRAFLIHIKELKLENNIFFHGIVNSKDKEEFLKRAHIFVLPTYYPWEGQPISIIEALAFATPVISTSYKGITEQVIDDYNGYLVRPHEPKYIADAIRKVVSMPDRYEKMSSNAHKHYENNFKREIHLKRIIPIICNDEY